MVKAKVNSAGLDNRQIARRLLEVAAELRLQAANPWRIDAYCTAAKVVNRLDRPLSDIYAKEGIDGVRRLPQIGDSLAASLVQLLRTGEMQRLSQVRAQNRKQDPLATLPGIGPKLASRIREQTGADSLEALQTLADGGDLRAISGVGKKRLQAIREVLHARLPQKYRRPKPPAPCDVNVLLALDEEYRQLATADQLPCVAPKAFNPSKTAWLPIFKTEREGISYHVMFSNSARAHAAGAVRDWVVIVRPGGRGASWTIVTGDSSVLQGKRVVRGLEKECRFHYANHKTQRELSF